MNICRLMTISILLVWTACSAFASHDLCRAALQKLDTKYFSGLGLVTNLPPLDKSVSKVLNQFIEGMRAKNLSSADDQYNLLRTLMKENNIDASPAGLREFAQALRYNYLHADAEAALWINFTHDFVLASREELGINGRLNLFLGSDLHAALKKRDFDMAAVEKKMSDRYDVLMRRVFEYMDEVIGEFNDSHFTKEQALKRLSVIEALITEIHSDFESLAIELEFLASQGGVVERLKARIDERREMLMFVFEAVGTQVVSGERTPGRHLRLPDAGTLEEPRQRPQVRSPSEFWDVYSSDLSWGEIPDIAHQIFPDFGVKKARIEISSLSPPAKNLAIFASLYHQIARSTESLPKLPGLGLSQEKKDLLETSLLSQIAEGVMEMKDSGMSDAQIQAELVRVFRDYTGMDESMKSLLGAGLKMSYIWNSAHNVGQRQLEQVFARAMGQLGVQ